MSLDKATCALIGTDGVIASKAMLLLRDRGERMCVYDISHKGLDKRVKAANKDEKGSRKLIQAFNLSDLLGCLNRPRIILIAVPAGKDVDQVLRCLIAAGLQPEDLVIDLGNSHWEDTIRRIEEYRGLMRFMGSGLSGGSLGARFGPALMPGGSPNDWERVRPLFEKIAARVDPETGKQLPVVDGTLPEGGRPCVALVGPNGSGHYVKSLHNGIEYAIMAVHDEAYWSLKLGLGLPANNVGEMFAKWNVGIMENFLLGSGAYVLNKPDPFHEGEWLIDYIDDAAGQKGTGRWVAKEALEIAAPATMINASVMSRTLSSRQEQRKMAASTLPKIVGKRSLDPEEFESVVKDAVLSAYLIAYTQGFDYLDRATAEYAISRGWYFDKAVIAKLWQGGCIIRSQLLQPIAEAYEQDRFLVNLLFAPCFRDLLRKSLVGLRTLVSIAAESGYPVPVLMAALGYLDFYCSERCPCCLSQGVRDDFGCHLHGRIDRDGRYHIG